MPAGFSTFVCVKVLSLCSSLTKELSILYILFPVNFPCITNQFFHIHEKPLNVKNTPSCELCCFSLAPFCIPLLW